MPACAPDELARVPLGDELDEAPRVARGDRPRHIIERDHSAAHIHAALMRRGFYESEACHLRVCAHDVGHGQRIVAQVIAVERVLGRDLCGKTRHGSHSVDRN